MILNQKPLVTFALFSYNQEDYVREAISGAFSQDYENLQIIISDDCSNDRTFQIMEEMVAEYHGPHTIRLNRNMSNLGIANHINEIMKIASGELIVVAAGDDISLPSRVSKLVDEWIQADKKPDLLCSDYLAIDASGVETGAGKGCRPEEMNLVSMAQQSCGVLGATAAWTSRLWGHFGGVPSNAVHEDQILPFRAAMMGGICYVPMPLVKYRQGVSTWINRFETIDTSEIQSRNKKLMHNAVITAHAQIGDAIVMDRSDLIFLINKRMVESLLIYQLYAEGDKLSAIVFCLRNSLSLSRVIKTLIKIRFPMLHKVILRRRVGTLM